MMLKIQALFLVLALLGLPLAAAADDHPSYQNGILTLPRVDTPEQIGKYQAATLQLTAEGNWTLLEVQELDIRTAVAKVVSAEEINAVEVIKTDTFPVHVLLRASGYTNACGFSGMGKVHQRRVGKHFDVLLSATHSEEYMNQQIGCVAAQRRIKMTLPLEVYGLGAGTYSYSVHGVTGTFSLDRDNKYADDCDMTSGCY